MQAKGPAPFSQDTSAPAEPPLPDSISDPIVPAVITLPSSESDTYATLLETIVCASDDAIITKNLDGIITSWNPAATAIFGYQPDEIIGHSILRLIPPPLHHEENEVIRRLRTGEIVHYETVRVAKDGREVLVSLTISPLRNKKGEVVGACKIARNLTEQRLLDRGRMQLAAIVESSDDAIISKDLNGIITSWNSAAKRLFGYEPEEIIGRSILTLIPEDLQDEEPVIISRLLAGKRIDHFETVRLTKNGDRIDVSLAISPIRDSNGKVVGASKILRDISERKRLQQSLLQAEKLAATGRMAASIAHEINNPLEGLLNLIYLARCNAADPAGVRSLLETAEGELDRVAHIARQTLGYYRENVSASQASLSAIATDALRIYAPRLRSAGIRVHADLPPAPLLLVKRGEIMQVISNLIVNAIHAMPDGGSLTLALRTAVVAGQEHVVLDVTDTGTGIGPAILQRVFEPFFTTRVTIGTGIGLWIARQFVEGHGGTIDVVSSIDPVAHGTTMTVALPIDGTSQPVQQISRASLATAP